MSHFAKRRLVLLGSTGSIGVQTLDVIDQLGNIGQELDVVGLSAGHDSPAFRAQIDRIQPTYVAVASQAEAATLQLDYPGCRVVHGSEGLIQLAQLHEIDLVVNALVGSVGLVPTLAALQSNKAVALANKESLAIAGHLIDHALAQGTGSLLSIDSEHHALYRCLGERPIEEVKRLLITASGGPFLRVPLAELDRVTPESALAHPTWSMGKRITIDSATMVNKAFEVIGAHRLFHVGFESIDVVIHPDSYVHSMIEFVDGSMLADIGPRDMRIAIQGILCHPHRLPTQLQRLPIEQGLHIDFEPFPHDRFPAFGTVLRAAHAGGSAMAAMNAADEVLVERFLSREIPLTRIASGLQTILDQWEMYIAPREMAAVDIDSLSNADAWAREQARQVAA